MQLTFRAKLIAIVAVDAIALLALVGLSTLVEQRTDRQLGDIRERLIPRIGLEARLGATFDKIARSYQDATDASDVDMIADAERHAAALRDQISAAADAMAPADAAALLVSLDGYVRVAGAVTREMIATDGAATIEHIQDMQGRQARTAELLESTTRFDEREMTRAFDAAAAAQRTGARVRLAIAGVCMLLVLMLTVWVGRSLSRTVGELVKGFRRFGDGDFATPIAATSGDELGNAADQANQMASRLQRLMAERDRSDWLKSGQAGLVETLRGELEPGEVADRALAFLGRHLGAPVGAIYYDDRAGALALLGRYGLELEPGAAPRFRRGEGVIGQAAMTTEVTVLQAPGDGTVRVRTGVIDIAPRAVALVPLIHVGEVVGVLELATLEPWSERATELLVAVRDTLTITIEVARGRAASRTLLAETQRQAAELLDARAGLVEKAEQLAKTSAYKSQFLANMSHELRTPMNAIIGFSELLYERPMDFDAAQQKEFLGHVLESSRHLMQLINDVLDLSKVEAGRLELRPEPLSVHGTIQEVLAILRTTAANRKVTLAAELDPTVDEAVLDPARFKQVLFNYLSNAIKFTPAGGRVEVRLKPEDEDRMRVEVADTGVGISADDVARLFVEFQQVGDDRRKASGTGLGLALTKRLVEAQGGSVGVESVPGRGSVFHAILPRQVAT